MLLAPNTVLPPEPVAGVVTLAPAYNVLTTMALINKIEETSELDKWIARTVAKLDEESLARQHLVFWGLGLESLANAVDLDLSTSEFPDYLDALKEADPHQLRDNIWQNIQHSSHVQIIVDGSPEPVPNDILASKEGYVSFYSEALKKLATANKRVPRETYARVHDLLTNPQALRNLLATHLGQLWEGHVAAEWQRIRPLLQDTVDAFQQINLQNLTVFDMIQTVTRRDLRTIFNEDVLLGFRQIQFVPSIHNGPYVMWSGKNDTFRLTFSAYIPQGISSRSAPQLNQTALLNRLKALADENRIKILDALRQEGEMSTQEMMEQLQLSKSALSRHLRQLRANSFIIERRVEGGVKKLYRLDPENGEKTLAGLADLLQVVAPLENG
jgi:DNA-binding transcriptional ArsR family regulator